MTTAQPGLSKLPVLILAGGGSRRMGGGDKADLVVEGARLIDRVQARLVDQAGAVVISGRSDYGTGLHVLSDRSDGPRGPVAGLYAAWRWADARGLSGLFSVAVDGPDVPLDLCARLHDQDESRVAADAERLHPTYGWWRMADLARAFAAMDLSQSVSLHGLVEATQATPVIWDGKPFFNINSPEDLRAYRDG